MQLLNVETLGYLASGLIVISLMMRSFLKLRMVNLFGAGTMAIYGLAIQSYPVAVLNSVIACIDIYYLYEMFSKRDYFTLLEVRKGSRYLKYFLTFYATEIKKFLPDFTYNEAETQHVFFILRNLVPAGLVITQPREGTNCSSSSTS
ncbi:MAG: hypothetical protein O7G31_02520 [Calditrichaeota bacterium]|nr:hypothetical protein [Calditrichota bacterium]